MSTVGLAIIARDEAKRLPALLKSIEGAFDQIVLVDTGSIDRTCQVFADWVEATGENGDWHKFKWIKDFSAARNYADAFLTTEWKVWADCDDIVIGAQNLRKVAAAAPGEVAGFIFEYDYAQHPETGACVCTLERERLVRNGRSEWKNRVHEAQALDGPVQRVSRDLAYWKHQKQAETQDEAVGSNSRNLKILEAWVKDEPENTRVLAYLGSENAARGELDTAKMYFKRYIALDPEWHEERAQVHRKLGMLYMMEQNFDAAISEAITALQVLPSWPDSYLTLAEAYHASGNHEKAIEWGRQVIERGRPTTMLIINPFDYDFQPRKIIAGSLASLNRIDEAVQLGQEALALNPADMALQQAMAQWRGLAKVEHTANTVSMMVQQLIAHDEQLKALALIEGCVPHFAQDHPKIVQLRAFLRSRLAWVDDPSAFEDHYATGGSKPEDFLADDVADEVCRSLPRVHFLMEGLIEQMRDQRITAMIDTQVPRMMEALSAE